VLISYVFSVSFFLCNLHKHCSSLQRGNPMGGLFYSNAFGGNGYTQVIEWHKYVHGHPIPPCFLELISSPASWVATPSVSKHATLLVPTPPTTASTSTTVSAAATTHPTTLKMAPLRPARARTRISLGCTQPTVPSSPTPSHPSLSVPLPPCPIPPASPQVRTAQLIQAPSSTRPSLPSVPPARAPPPRLAVHPSPPPLPRRVLPPDLRGPRLLVVAAVMRRPLPSGVLPLCWVSHSRRCFWHEAFVAPIVVDRLAYHCDLTYHTNCIGLFISFWHLVSGNPCVAGFGIVGQYENLRKEHCPGLFLCTCSRVGGSHPSSFSVCHGVILSSHHHHYHPPARRSPSPPHHTTHLDDQEGHETPTPGTRGTGGKGEGRGAPASAWTPPRPRRHHAGRGTGPPNATSPRQMTSRRREAPESARRRPQPPRHDPWRGQVSTHHTRTSSTPPDAHARNEREGSTTRGAGERADTSTTPNDA